MRFRVISNIQNLILIRTLVVLIANYPIRVGTSGKFFLKSTQLALKLPVIGSNTVHWRGF